MAQMNLYIKVIDIHGCQSASSANPADCPIWQYSAAIMPLLLAMATLGDKTQIGPILFVLRHPLWPRQVKAGLHDGDYRSKIVHFEAQKNIFHVKKALA